LRRLFTGVVICAAGWLGPGCALRAPIVGNSTSAESSKLPGNDSLETHIEKVRHLSTRPVARVTAPANIERQDRELADALQQLALSRTGEAHRRVAERYRALGVSDVAYEHFSRALAMNGRDAAAHDGLARVWRDWGFPNLALGDVHRAVFYAPASAAVHNTMGTVLQALGQHDSARAAYERASRLQPGAAYALSNLCYLSFLDGDFERAVSTCRSALVVDPAFMAARNNLALAHAAAGRLDLARAEFLDAGDQAVGLFNMGIVHMAGGNYALATSAFNAASRSNPSMSIARERASQARRLARNAGQEKSGEPK